MRLTKTRVLCAVCCVQTGVFAPLAICNLARHSPRAAAARWKPRYMLYSWQKSDQKGASCGLRQRRGRRGTRHTGDLSVRSRETEEAISREGTRGRARSTSSRSPGGSSCFFPARSGTKCGRGTGGAARGGSRSRPSSIRQSRPAGHSAITEANGRTWACSGQQLSPRISQISARRSQLLISDGASQIADSASLRCAISECRFIRG